MIYELIGFCPLSPDARIFCIRYAYLYFQTSIYSFILCYLKKKVYQVFSEDKKKVLAIKYVTLECADNITIQGYINEITLLQKLRKSGNIIHLYD